MDTIESAAEHIEGIDGLLLIGGEDVSPLFYGENPIKEVEYFAPERDELDWALNMLRVVKKSPCLLFIQTTDVCFDVKQVFQIKNNSHININFPIHKYVNKSAD